MKTIDTQKIIDDLQAILPGLKVKPECPLAPYTTVKIGGPAELLIETKSSQELKVVASYAQQEKLALTVLGWGANTLIADAGIRGITVVNKSSLFHPISKTPEQTFGQSITPRWNSLNSERKEFFDYYTGTEKQVLVELDSGTPLPYAINFSLSQGLTGLEWFSRIPATIGGAIYNNIHGGAHFISDQLHSVTILNESGEIQTLFPSDLELAYDYSRFHHTQEIILSAELVLFRGNVERARIAAATWAQQKKHQPQNSLGCVFQNLTTLEQARLDLPTTSIGYFIEKKLKLAGFTIGGARVSTNHAAFIENTGGATALDYLKVISQIQTQAKNDFQVMMKPEIFFRGFSDQELELIKT